MEAFLLAAHVLAGILFIGPATVAASLFPRYVPITDPVLGNSRDEQRSPRTASALHRVTRVYGVLGVLVPVFGISLALWQQRFGEIWITIAMVLTAVAGGLLAFRIVPAQSRMLGQPLARKQLFPLAAIGGVFNLLWAAVVILMIVRPGSDYAP